MELVQPEKHPTIQCRYSILGCQSPQKTPKMLLAVYSLFHSNISTEKKKNKNILQQRDFRKQPGLVLNSISCCHCWGHNPAGVSNLLKTFALNLTLFL